MTFVILLLTLGAVTGSEVRFSSSQYQISETASKIEIQAVRDDTTGVVQVDVQIVGGTAQSTQDYFLTTDVISFPDGAGSADLSVFVVDNAVVSNDKDIVVELVSQTEGVSIGSPGTTQIVIADNDADGFPGLGFSGHWFSQFGSFAPRIQRIVPDTQGRWLVAGAFTTANGHAQTNLVRLLADGSVDSSFNPSFSANLQIFTVVLTDQEKILIGGQFTEVNGSPVGRIAQLLPDGTLDPEFNHGPGFSGFTVESLEVLPDGRILVAGNISAFEGTDRRTVAILKSDGKLDESFDPISAPYNATGHGAVWMNPGVVVLADVRGTNSVFKLNADGSRDTNFVCDIEFPGTPISPTMTAVHRQPDGKIIIGGRFASVNGFPRTNIARINADGSTDETFDPGSGANNWVFRIEPWIDGKILLVGRFTEYNGETRGGVAVVKLDGSLETTFDPGLGSSEVVYAGFASGDGSVYVGGLFNSFAGVQRFALTSLNPDGSVRLQEPRFIDIHPSDENSAMARLLCEPNFDQLIYESTILPNWQSTGAISSAKRVIEILRPVDQSSQLFLRAEQIDP